MVVTQQNKEQTVHWHHSQVKHRTAKPSSQCAKSNDSHKHSNPARTSNARGQNYTDPSGPTSQSSSERNAVRGVGGPCCTTVQTLPETAGTRSTPLPGARHCGEGGGGVHTL